MRIAHIVLNDFTRDSRVQKFAATTGLAHDSTVVALSSEDLPAFEQGDGYRVERIPMRTKPSKRTVGRLEAVGLYHLWKAVMFAEFVVRTVRRFGRYDVWQCNDIEALIVGAIAKLFGRRLVLVYDCHEFEAERNGQSAFKGRVIARLERLLLPWVSEVIQVSPSIEAAYRDRYGLERTTLIRNMPHSRSEADETVDFRKKFPIPAEARIAIYQGAFIPNRGLEQTLKAFEQIDPAAIHVVMMGYGALQPLVEQAASTLENVHFQEAVPYNQILSYSSAADFGLLSVRPTCLSYLYCLPNKLFEYIQAGLPILSNALPDCAAIMSEYAVGEVAEAGLTAESILSFSSRLDDLLAVADFKKAQAELNWQRESEKILALYARINVEA